MALKSSILSVWNLWSKQGSQRSTILFVNQTPRIFLSPQSWQEVRWTASASCSHPSILKQLFLKAPFSSSSLQQEAHKLNLSTVLLLYLSCCTLIEFLHLKQNFGSSLRSYSSPSQFPRESQPSRLLLFLAKSSTLRAPGTIKSIKVYISSGFWELFLTSAIITQLETFVLKLKISPFFFFKPTRHISEESRKKKP